MPGDTGFSGPAGRGGQSGDGEVSRTGELSTGREAVHTGLVLVFVGLPGSGKSTWAEENRVPVISTDALRGVLADDITDQSVNKQVFLYVRALLRTRLAIGRPVTAVDATSVTREGRAVYIRIARHFGARVEAVYFDTPLAECLRRNLERERMVPEEAILRMAGQLEAPSIGEGFDAVRIVTP
ncbi:MAG: AAA family ATPase [Acidobacteriota bacterium]